MKSLTTAQAKEQLKKHGRNQIQSNNNNSAIKIFFRQIKNNYLIYLLTIATIISFLVGKDITAYTIIAVILIVVFVGFFMEYRAEKAIAALKNLIVQESTVVRDNKEQEIPSYEIVPKDIIKLHTGDKIPADGIIIEQKGLRVNESVLTGEAKEVHKTATQNNTDFKEVHKAYMGTYVVHGHATVLVTHTGMNTEFGKIAEMITETEKDLPLQDKVNKIIKYMSINAVFFAIITGFVMLVRDGPLTQDILVEILIVVVALSVSAFPEGYPVVLVSTLAVGARRMAAKNAIVNRMAIIETLGETTTICTDKTGTITKGEMTVKKIYTPEHMVKVTGVGYSSKGSFFLDEQTINPNNYPHIHTLVKASILCNEARIDLHENKEDYKVRGSQTEAALLILGAKAKLHKDDFNYEKLEEIPFSSHNKMMSVLVQEHKDKVVYAKGAPEILLDKCTTYRINNKEYKLTQEKKKEFLEIAEKNAKKSYRVLALAMNKRANKNSLDTTLEFLGFAIMEDPAREEAKDAIKSCLNAGIQVKMLTGDNKLTAQAIAQKVGLQGHVLEGFELDELTDQELTIRLQDTTVFARVRPEHKMRIVHLLKAQGEVVAMTGDGVNDAPALKEAQVGVAMGKNGTDVTREVSDLVLKDDNFATIVEAVAEGRTIFKNIQKFTTYQVSITLAQVGFIFLAIMLGFPLPLVAMQILFINLLSDELTAIMLGLNRRSKDVLTKQPRKGSNIIDKNLAALMALSTSTIILVTLASFVYMIEVLETPIPLAQSFAFLLVVLFGVTSAFNFRSFRQLVTQQRLLVNKYLFIASIAAIICTIIIMYTPLNTIFETTPLPAIYWLYAGLLSLTIIIVFDIVKALNKKHHFLNLH